MGKDQRRNSHRGKKEVVQSRSNGHFKTAIVKVGKCQREVVCDED